MSMPVIRLRQSVQFPANVYGDTGIAVTKASGNFTIETDWSQFTTLSGVPGSTTNNVLTYDTATKDYAMVPTSLLGGSGGGGGLLDAPVDGFSYGRLNSAWAKVAPLASPALTGTPTAPTAAPATNTTQIATTAFVGAAVTASGGVTPAALTRTSDTNVQLTLGGTPATALLQATSITVSWSGTLSAARGGFGADISAQNGVPLFSSGAATFTLTTGTGTFVRSISPVFTGTPTIHLNRAVDSNVASLSGEVAGNPRWQLHLGNGAESTGNAGSDLLITRFDNTGTFIDTAFAITRASGLVSMNSATLNPQLAIPAHPASLQIGSDGAHSSIATRSTVDGVTCVVFDNASGGVAGSIFQNTSSVSYNTTSDLRLKEDLKSFDAGNIIDDTEVYDFAWKSTKERAYGVVAQQAVEIYPQAVTYDEKLDWHGVDYSKYVPVILQELKALRARVRELEARFDPKVAQ